MRNNGVRRRAKAATGHCIPRRCEVRFCTEGRKEGGREDEGEGRVSGKYRTKRGGESHHINLTSKFILRRLTPSFSSSEKQAAWSWSPTQPCFSTAPPPSWPPASYSPKTSPSNSWTAWAVGPSFFLSLVRSSHVFLSPLLLHCPVSPSSLMELSSFCRA